MILLKYNKIEEIMLEILIVMRRRKKKKNSRKFEEIGTLLYVSNFIRLLLKKC